MTGISAIPVPPPMSSAHRREHANSHSGQESFAQHLPQDYPNSAATKEPQHRGDRVDSGLVEDVAVQRPPVRPMPSATSQDVAGAGALRLWPKKPPLPAIAEVAIGAVPGQQVWSRVFPEGWMANGYLSFVQMTPDGPPLVSSPNSLEGAFCCVPVGSTEGAADIATLTVASQEQNVPGQQSPVGASGVPPAELDVPQRVERLARALGPIIAADRPWAERLLRTSTGERGAVTVWLRDFSLTAEEVARVKDAIRYQAGKEGIALGRIVVNGQTVWIEQSAQRSE